LAPKGKHLRFLFKVIVGRGEKSHSCVLKILFI